MTFKAIIVAGGSGTRSGGRKQWMPLAGKPVLNWSVETFENAGASEIAIVVPEDDVAKAQAEFPNATVTPGGSTRAQSVQAGLKALKAADDDIVMIHDAARPLLTGPLIESLLLRMQTTRAVILALPVTDLLKKTDHDTITNAPPREHLWRAQTPQAFRYGDIVRAYQAWPNGQEPTDDAIVADHAGIRVEVVEGSMRLHKLTYKDDFELLEALIMSETQTQMRVGQGFDAHRWRDGESVWLCGVEIPHDKTLIGHSDADAGLHALTDAILGAVGLGDIGDHFPPTDPQWKGAPSDLFLKHAVTLVRQNGGRLVNVDVTLICERPKVKPHREAMRARLSEILSLPMDCISVKATTTEKMGFTGREEGLAAQAICLIEMPVVRA
ncbi:bifunctional 2-C-methyl-D-erythritol 4-phosphate cytidylyltransferase/2-C-methyl-D-erythritol 2,4-cyclodiphosphate synthase [Asticcacaulis sp. ZE23SCel15]|uniref:bifunctional 2-C-methyl-D-erythritol 4-phosphate cytidylyltransferase/2-C-methyl-D-erythritol 2,4-cyclodiphosphate synthase n=1 Tax=Asticcacaulis sp. ZE23SCel15 TaxID=3059027 RepID=UPI00265E2BE4|nr:bifunctional 2-C-methyl-D-erythritol 4-phosphate cytidylyltransferase/2-C-methyl-D-erythritol 2,4-cyclodiphosphate synthase [Asticcacaulis sp. ZE23SCel15]WKL56647.1 bifunctional 2-C-methyl-D-erythritol 4-phosphate cytidylyltransferase/2-C-methyl-D-erythritol 2,4-cyclodiphosphate synthase [Asticcacaulis sp. ZE23SCel15]